MSTVDKLKCYVCLLMITVATSVLLLCYFSFTSNVGMRQHDKANVENLDDGVVGILNPGCISRKLRDY